MLPSQCFPILLLTIKGGYGGGGMLDLTGAVITYSDEIEEQLAGLQAEVAHYRQLYFEAHQKNQFLNSLFEVSQETLTVSHKASVHAITRYIESHEQDRDERGYIKLDGWQAGALSKQSYGTLMSNLGKLSREMRIHDGVEVETDIGRVPIFDRLVVRVLTNDRQTYPQGYYLETYIKERDNTFEPAHYKTQTPIEWGGKRKNAGRKKCKKCNAWMKPVDHIRKIQREHICPNCHTHEWDEEIRVSDEVPVTSDLIEEPVERDEASKNQVDFCPPDAVDDASKAPLDEVYASPLLHQVACEVEATLATTPITTQDFSVESFLQQRIGHGPIIWHTGSQVNTDSDPKYLTKPLEYVPSISAYLRGDVKHIYGSRPALPNGTTYLLGFDLDTAELDKSHKYMMFMLALAGIASVYWKRRPGRGHLEIYTDRPVDRKAFYTHAVRVCPDLAQVPEVFPIGSDQNANGDDRSDYGYSWPLSYRIDNKVIECSAEFMFPDRPGELVSSSGYQSDRPGLEHLLSRAIVDAAIIPVRPVSTEIIPQLASAQNDVLLLEKPLNRSYRDGDDLKPIVLDEWNRTHSWDEVINLCGGIQKNKHFFAVWRRERTASVKVDPDGRYACDYGSKRGAYSKKLDKGGVYCLAQGLDQTQEINRLC